MNAVLTHRFQRGLTLIELMLALTIGMVLLLGAMAMFTSSNARYIAQGETAEADEGGRYALDVIGRAIRQAAYIDWEKANVGAGIDTAKPARLAGLDARSISKTSDGIANPLSAAVNGSDVLAIRFPGSGAAPKGDGSMLNCAGFAVKENDEGWSIFYVARDADGNGELRCKYRGASSWSADAVVPGVDGFQVLYGVDTDEPADGVPNRYVNATAIAALDAGLVLNGATATEREKDLNRRTWWKRIVAVQYALLLRGARRAQDAEGIAAYDLFGPAYADAYSALDPGTRLSEQALAGRQSPRERRLFRATVALSGAAR
jgi:type IV pilus assembly protein PilW